MKHRFQCIVILFTLAFATVVARPAQATEYASPQALLLTYYNAINRQDYATAYALWLSPRQTYRAFAAGFADTTRVEPYFGGLQTRNSTQAGYVPALLLGYQTDGRVFAYYGCFTVSYQGVNGVTWRIAGGNFHLLTSLGVPDNAVIAAYLAIDCFNPPTAITPDTATITSNLAAPTILAYYDAINSKAFPAAYTYWLQPLPGPKPNGAPAQDYRPTFTAFQNGYADTAYVNAYFGTYNQTGASAGHSYLDGLLPAVLVGQKTDGTFAAYSGCYVMGYLPNGVLGIVNGKFTLVANDVPTGDVILQYVNLDCTQLAIPN